jgi:hypothetical protein
VKSVLLGSVFSLALWLGWLLVAYTLIQRLAGMTVPVDQLVRGAGFAAAPLALGVLMVLPAISFGVGVVAVAAWLLLTQQAIERVTALRGGVPLLANAAGFAVWASWFVAVASRDMPPAQTAKPAALAVWAGGMSLLATATNQLAPGPFLAEAIWEALASLDLSRGIVG